MHIFSASGMFNFLCDEKFKENHITSVKVEFLLLILRKQNFGDKILITTTVKNVLL